ncbi:hypothetical protein CYG49_01225 [Candidatus Saccharibacteria bacterium]|nr:MAG: hypothetical protein CYG49_01225 [Candidatus Saccharibacteria bacterium]
MSSDLLLFFLAGVFAANGIPHFVKGITGEHHMTPFGKPSGPVVNVLWGSANFISAFLLLAFLVRQEVSFTGATICFWAGAVVTALLLAVFWDGDDEARGHRTR